MIPSANSAATAHRDAIANRAADAPANPAAVEADGALPRGCTNFKLRQLVRRIARHYDAEFAKAGLKGTQYSLLSKIVARGPLRPNDLAREMGMDASTLTRNLRVVINEGWVVQRAGSDERSRLIEITPAGRAKQLEARRHWKRAQLGLNEILGAEQVASLHALIDLGMARFGQVDAGE
jgi:DNA-binding MarR family transcriptional regulator